MRRSLCLSCYATAVVSLSFAALTVLASEPDAEQMMIVAHEARATWDGLPGFTAEVVVSTNDEISKGRMTVSVDCEVLLEMPDAPHSKWVEGRLRSLVRHRMPHEGPRQFNVSFADDVQTHPLGHLIRFNEDSLHSVYRVQKDVITEVHRTMGDSRFTITVVDNAENIDGKQLPKVYTVSWWDAASGGLTACEVVTNQWVRVGQWDLPEEILIVRTEAGGNRQVRKVSFRDHRLLTVAIKP